MRRKNHLLSVSVAAILFGCSADNRESPTSTGGPRGAISLRIAVAPGSPFKSIAKSGDITVSAADMATLTSPLILGDSTVEASIQGIPSGKDRLLQLKVYDSAGAVRYKGSANVDISSDSTSKVSVTLARVTGSISIVGTVSENDSAADSTSTAWGASLKLTVGAQASTQFGATVDLDSMKVWTASLANANLQAVDLVFMHYLGGFHLDNAVAAKAAGVANGINMTSSYDDARIKDVKMVKLSVRPANQESAKRAFASGAKIQGSVILAGDMLIVESTEKKLVLVTVASFTGSNNSASTVLKLEQVTLP